jgi:hypothetical protein
LKNGISVIQAQPWVEGNAARCGMGDRAGVNMRSETAGDRPAPNRAEKAKFGKSAPLRVETGPNPLPASLSIETSIAEI